MTASPLLQELSDRVKALGGDWAKYAVVGSFVLYALGYLVLRFHVTTLGVATDLSILDERYVFTGARFLVYLVATVPSLVLFAIPFAAIAFGVNHLLVSDAARARARAWALAPTPLSVCAIVFAVLMIQLVMRQCFVLENVLVASEFPRSAPSWLAHLVRSDLQRHHAPDLMPLYFDLLVASCAVPALVLWKLQREPLGRGALPVARRLLVFLALVQALLLPINFGVLVVDKSLARVSALGDTPLPAGDQAWIAWDGRESVTFLRLTDGGKRRVLVTLPHSEAKRIVITGYDRIFPLLFPLDAGGSDEANRPGARRDDPPAGPHG